MLPELPRVPAEREELAAHAQRLFDEVMRAARADEGGDDAAVGIDAVGDRGVGKRGWVGKGRRK